ncbi:MAG: hypothetical protein RH946_09400 [Rhodospirillales bacterium]
MDMSRLNTFSMVCLLTAPFLCGVASASEQTNAPAQSTPLERDFVQPESCFGASNENDDDLKTGNEAAVYEALRLLLGPGS